MKDVTFPHLKETYVSVMCGLTSKSIGGASVAVHHAPGVSGSAARHASAVIKGLSLPAKTWALLSRLLVASRLLLEGTNY